MAPMRERRGVEGRGGGRERERGREGREQSLYTSVLSPSPSIPSPLPSPPPPFCNKENTSKGESGPPPSPVRTRGNLLRWAVFVFWFSVGNTACTFEGGGGRGGVGGGREREREGKGKRQGGRERRYCVSRERWASFTKKKNPRRLSPTPPPSHSTLSGFFAKEERKKRSIFFLGGGERGKVGGGGGGALDTRVDGGITRVGVCVCVSKAGCLVRGDKGGWRWTHGGWGGRHTHEGCLTKRGNAKGRDTERGRGRERERER